MGWFVDCGQLDQASAADGVGAPDGPDARDVTDVTDAPDVMDAESVGEYVEPEPSGLPLGGEAGPDEVHQVFGGEVGGHLAVGGRT